MALATDPSWNNLRLYISDMVALEKHILEAIERQREDERLQPFPECKDLLDRIHITLRAHVLTMENHAAAIGENLGASVKEVVSSFAGVLAGFYDKVRKHPVSRLLRDDHTALSLAATAYSMLYTTGLATREHPIANVSMRHLQELTLLVMELTRIIPEVVLVELGNDDPAIDHSVLKLAQENSVKAWCAAK